MNEKKDNIRRFAVLMIVVALLSSVTVISAYSASSKTLLGALGERPEFSTLVSVLRNAGVENTLNTQGAYTLLAPTNGAFNKLPSGFLNNILGNKQALMNIAKNHVIPGKLTTSALSGMKEIKTIDGKTLPVEIRNGNLYIGGVMLAGPGIDASNGVIYPVDNVLLPAGIAPSPGAVGVMGQTTGAQPAANAPAFGNNLLWLLGALALGLLGLLALSRLLRGHRREETRTVAERVREEGVVLDDTAIAEVNGLSKDRIANMRTRLADLHKSMIGYEGDLRDKFDIFVRNAGVRLLGIKDMGAVKGLAEKYNLNMFNSGALELALENDATIYTRDVNLLDKYRAAGAKADIISKLM
jgi:uncharacterized surface protein with fasciclin (FAS1) repeats